MFNIQQQQRPQRLWSFSGPQAGLWLSLAQERWLAQLHLLLAGDEWPQTK